MANPVLEELDVLIGDWAVEVMLPTETSESIRGRSTIRRAHDGAFLEVRTVFDEDLPPDSLSVIGRDEKVGAYAMLYVDERGVSRIYQMAFDGVTWRLQRAEAGFHQRFTGTLSSDRRVISAAWERSSDGTRWELDFEMTYTRIGD